MEKSAVMTYFIVPRPIQIIRHYIYHIDISKVSTRDASIDTRWPCSFTGREQEHRNLE